MYCPECGHKLTDDNFRYCPECGTMLDNDNSCDIKSISHDSIYGIVLTNTEALAQSLNADAGSVTSVIESFIERKKDSGVYYRLLNVRSGRPASLGECIGMLHDTYRKMSAKENTPTHLFIIGGNDVIPMPQISNFIKDTASDATIDTDIIYSYPYKENLISLLENQKLFSYKQLLLTGRLPFGKDASLSDLVSYLDRALEVSEGIQLGRAYGQCDPNWKIVSSIITDHLARNRMLPDLDAVGDGRFCYGKLFLSPFVDFSNIGQVFDTGASLYYFNLHGGEGDSQSGYFGALPPEYEQRKMFLAIKPENIATAMEPNIIISEACYGAKFINLRKQDSMMLTSIHNSTIAFVGSSRVAWGACDNINTGQNQDICSADIIAKVFIESLTAGMDAGEALFTARKELMSHVEPGDIFAATTVTEFNLFGDPTSRFAAMPEYCGSTKNTAPQTMSEPLLDGQDWSDFSTEPAVCPDSSGHQGILGLVRSAVDSNIAVISQVIAEYLYSNYGIEPRKPYNILKIRKRGKDDNYCFFYDCEKENNMKFMVQTDRRGNVFQVQATR